MCFGRFILDIGNDFFGVGDFKIKKLDCFRFIDVVYKMFDVGFWVLWIYDVRDGKFYFVLV